MAVSKDGQQYRFAIPGISAADLKFLHWMPRVRNRNLKSKAAVEQDCFELNRPGCWPTSPRARPLAGRGRIAKQSG